MQITFVRDLPRKGWESIEIYSNNLISILQKFYSSKLKVKDFRAWSSIAARLSTNEGFSLWLYQHVINPIGAYFAQSELTHIACQSDSRMLYLLDQNRTVISVHDILTHWYKDKYKNHDYLTDLEPLKSARHIIAVSEFVKSELVNKLNISPDIITVIPCCVESYFTPAKGKEIQQTRHRFGLPAKYILYVGSANPHKNLLFLIKVIARVLKYHPEIYLVKVGVDFKEEQKELINCLGIQSRVISLGFVEHSQLPAIYSGAMFYIQASLTEGFGLPILEAMSCGTPVLLSDTLLFRGLFGKGAEFFSIDSIGVAAKQVDQMIFEVLQSNKYKEKVLAASREYSHKRVSKMLKTYYEKVIRSTSPSKGSFLRYIKFGLFQSSSKLKTIISRAL